MAMRPYDQCVVKAIQFSMKILLPFCTDPFPFSL